MQTIPFYIDQTGGLAIAQLTARARRLKRQRGLDLLVVDYLQLLSGSAKKGENRVQELTEITTGQDRKSTRLNSSHANISYAVFCLKKKKNKQIKYIFIL